MANNESDLDLLLSLQDRVLETPPGSPPTLRPQSPGYLSDDESAKRTGPVDISVFRDVVEDCPDYYGPENAKQALKAKQMKKQCDPDVEHFSGLRIRCALASIATAWNQLVSSVELNNRFSDIRFVRLSAIKNVLNGDTLHGCWATVGVVTEKGITKVSSTGKNFCIWKIGSLDEKTISVFLFGDAYQKFSKETPGAVLAFFNCGVRKDNMGGGFSLSVYSAAQILKIGTSADYGVCRGKRKDGMACTLVINKRRGVYCSYHRSAASEKYTNKRSELKGGNLNTAFRGPYKPEGVYMVDPLAGRSKTNNKSKRPIQFLCVDDMKKALSNADKVTTNVFSQGIRFLTEVTGKMAPQPADKACNLSKLQTSGKRPLYSTKPDAAAVRSHQTNGKKAKVESTQNPKKNEVKEKMIELDFVSSDEEL